jgi:hypothetical protein
MTTYITDTVTGIIKKIDYVLNKTATTEKNYNDE